MRIQSNSAPAFPSRSHKDTFTTPSADFTKSRLTLVKKDPGNKNSSALTSFFNEICPLSEEAIAAIHDRTEAVFFKKGQYLGAGSGKNNCLYFILKGVVRGYVKEGGKDITMWINADHEMVGSIPTLGILLPSDQHMQALEDSILVRVPQKLIEYLSEHFPEASLINRALIDDYNQRTMQRAAIRRIGTPEERFRRFKESLPELLNRIPFRYVASYLDLPLEVFSRLRAEWE